MPFTSALVDNKHVPSVIDNREQINLAGKHPLVCK